MIIIHWERLHWLSGQTDLLTVPVRQKIIGWDKRLPGHARHRL